ncbi:hypothetical protein BJG92_03459 [Arthrobacter sp. SO5]|uniref:hypothetical protein n=1 Tax=Arthrobacter sp. SO5 TaxID=1897055 RepID=UPI001E3A109D|nr:hypothetical protein [Arthrobacter sp. SO5]MCB5275905.1 hypothetical protein [Arthrobacter sp. SO5]
MTEFASLTSDDFELYAGQMEQIKARIKAAAGFFEPPNVYPSVEAGLLQLRLALETLVLSSLVTNRKAVEAVSTAFAKKEHKDAFKLAKELNPAFWPVPCTQIHDDDGEVIEMRAIAGGHLTEDEYLPTWGRLSAWLHATNPFQTMPEPSVGATYGIQVARKLVVLLDHHYLSLLERGESMVCMMNEANSGRVHTFGFEPA